MSLTAKQRKSIPKKDFGLPGRRAYPVDSRAHAISAERLAPKEEKAGKLSPSAEKRIVAKAHKFLKNHPK